LKRSIRSEALLFSLCFFFLTTCHSVFASAAELTAEHSDTEKLLALTFDDGPSSSVTPKLLDGLAERGVHATFFLIGNRIEGNEALVTRMESEGHQVGIHTYSHVAITGLTQTQFYRQIGRTRELLTSILGEESFPLRPPYGFVDKNVIQWSNAPIILWSVDPKDWSDHNVQRIASVMINQASPGDIILLHDIFSSTVEATLTAVDELLRQGYYFVTVEELFSAYGILLENGTIYRCAPNTSADQTTFYPRRYEDD